MSHLTPKRLKTKSQMRQISRLLAIMVLAGIWSINLRNALSLTTSHSLKLLRHRTFVNSKRVLNTGSLSFEPLITTDVDARDEQPGSSKAYISVGLMDATVQRSPKSKAKKQKKHEFKVIQYSDVQQKKADGKDVTVLVFDIETTGFHRSLDKIIEFGIQDLRGGKNSTFHTLVNPERPVLNSHIHGISTQMVNRPDVPRWKDLAPILLHYIQSRQIDGRPVLLVAHNARSFDIPFIVNEFARCSIDIPSDWLFLDTLPLARELVKPDGSKLSSYKLEALREHYEIPLEGAAHRAMSDVHSLSLILQKITFDKKLSVSALMDRSFIVSK